MNQEQRKEKNSIGTWCDAVSRKEKRQMPEGKKMRKERKIVEEMSKKKHAYYGITTERWGNYDIGEQVPPTCKHIGTIGGYWVYSLGGTNVDWIKPSMTLKEIREVVQSWREYLDWAIPKENMYLVAGDEAIAQNDGTIFIVDAVLVRVL